MARRSLEYTLALSALVLVACSSSTKTGTGAPDGSADGSTGGSSQGGSSGKGGSSAGGVGGKGTGGAVNTGGGTATGGTGNAGGSGGGSGGAGNAAGTDGGGGAGGTTGTGGAGGAELDATIPVDAFLPDGSIVTCNGSTVSDVTQQGVVAASSVNSLSTTTYAATMAVDGDVASAWFADFNVAAATYTWSDTRDDCITRIQTTNTHLVTPIWADWGFESVTVKVLNAAGKTVFSTVVNMTGFPDPNLDIATGGVVARRVELDFSGLESTATPAHTAGGIAELNVSAKR